VFLLPQGLSDATSFSNSIDRIYGEKELKGPYSDPSALKKLKLDALLQAEFFQTNIFAKIGTLEH
jgi:hypothetical protein